MDIYEISFIFSTLWIGPFWFAMMIKPYDEKTNKMMNNSLFFMGPIIVWLVVMLISPGSLSDFINSFTSEKGFIAGLAKSLSTKQGTTALWAHMVAGDILATRWIWRKSIEKGLNPIVRNISLFFGVMLMPIGVLLLTTACIFKKT
tara:strand:+ start:3321 stop:3758 length:438 start_codon:yes stop_codon:yes gene_type:complete